jgi:hypothetical protein
MRRRGDIAEALSAAAAAGPAPIRTLAERAQVGYASARYTCSRMIGRAELVVLDGCRPWVVALPVPEVGDGQGSGTPFAALPRQRWCVTP